MLRVCTILVFALGAWAQSAAINPAGTWKGQLVGEWKGLHNQWIPRSDRLRQNHRVRLAIAKYRLKVVLNPDSSYVAVVWAPQAKKNVRTGHWKQLGNDVVLAPTKKGDRKQVLTITDSGRTLVTPIPPSPVSFTGKAIFHRALTPSVNPRWRPIRSRGRWRHRRPRIRRR